MTEDFIAGSQHLNIGGHKFIVGDRVDVDRWMKSKDLDERTFGILKRQEYIVPLTRERFAVAMARRPAGSPPPVGFTDAYLIEKGIIDAPIERHEDAPKPRVEPIRKIEFNDNTVQVGRFYRTPHKAGVAPAWTVTDADGNILSPRAFRSTAKADAFIQSLSTGAESSGSGEDTPPPKDSANDRDVQSSADGHDQPDQI